MMLQETKSQSFTLGNAVTANYPLQVADVLAMGQPAKLFGLATDSYFSGMAANVGVDIAGHSAAFGLELAKVPQDGVILDIGANIGVTVLSSSRQVPHGRVIGVEPSPICFEALCKSIDANGLGNCIAFKQCIGEYPGLVPFRESTEFLAGSYVGSDARESTNNFVDMTTLDQLVKDQELKRIDLIKIDVEGFELDVLKGASRTIDRFYPRFVLEYNSFALTANRNLSPRALLDFIVDRFEYFEVDQWNARYVISTPHDVRDFIFGNMVHHGCVQDIMFGGRA